MRLPEISRRKRPERLNVERLVLGQLSWALGRPISACTICGAHQSVVERSWERCDLFSDLRVDLATVRCLFKPVSNKGSPKPIEQEREIQVKQGSVELVPY